MRLGIILTTSPLQYQNWETAVNLAEAALAKGHQVHVFLYIDGTYNPLSGQSFPGPITHPKDRFADLLRRGAKVTSCVLCANARGLERGKDYISGITIGNLPHLSEIIGQVDRLVTL